MKRKLYIEAPAALTPRWRIMGVCIVLVCIIFTFILWFFLENSNREFAQNRLSDDADTALDVLETRVEVYGDVLYGTRALLLAQPNVTREQWDAYTLSQGLFDRYPGLNSILYAKAGQSGDATDILADINDARLDGEPVVAITPDEPTDRVALIKYTTSTTSRRAIGMNVFASENVAPTLTKADTVGVPTASPLFPSRAADRMGTNDFVIVLAIYNGSYRAEMTDEQKHAAVTGYAIASLHPETLFNAAVNKMRTSEAVFIQATNNAGKVVYETGSTIDEEYVERTATVTIGDEDWQILFRAPATYELSPREIIAPTFFLIGGSLFMIMLVVIYFYRQGLRVKWRQASSIRKQEAAEEVGQTRP